MTVAAHKETLDFQAEVSQVLNLPELPELFLRQEMRGGIQMATAVDQQRLPGDVPAAQQKQQRLPDRRHGLHPGRREGRQHVGAHRGRRLHPDAPGWRASCATRRQIWPSSLAMR